MMHKHLIKQHFVALAAIICTTASAEVDDFTVKKWLVGALDRVSPTSEQAADAKLASVRATAKVQIAWFHLKECRDAGNSLDLNLAAAEHYLFIRAFSSEMGSHDVVGLPAMYGKLKTILGPAANLIKTSDQPVSPVDANVIRWGDLGVSAGLNDYTKIAGQPAKAAGGNMGQLKIAVQGYYRNYAQKVISPKCKVEI